MVRQVIMLGVLGLAAPAFSEDPARGKEVFDSASPKCKVCHAIGGVGNAKGSLDGVGSQLKAEEIKAGIRTPKEMAAKAKAERKPPMLAYPVDKLPNADLDVLVAYLLSLKK